jgi:hypothetical protein
MLTAKYDMMLTQSRINLIAQIYAASICDINGVMTKIRDYYDQIKEMGAYFCRTHDLNFTIHEDATDFMILQMHDCQTTLADFHKKLTADFEYGFKLVRDRTGQNDFVITREALEAPEQFLNTLVKDMYTQDGGLDAELDNP